MHEGYCSIIPVRVAERLRSASQKDGTLLFDIRQRKHGPTWVKFDPRVHLYAGVGRVP
jgi:hypothetical protein